jgi:hypothetical protein
VKAFFADLCCLSYLLFTNLPPGGSPARTLNLLPAPSSRRIAPNAGGYAGESLGWGGRSIRWQDLPPFRRSPTRMCPGRRLPGCHAQRPLREHANCHKTCPRRADGHATPPGNAVSDFYALSARAW